MVDELFANVRNILPRFEDVEEECAFGCIHSISGPVIVAKNLRGVAVHELVLIGSDELLGEVLSLKEDKTIIQVFAETGSLRVGDMVLRTGHPLLIELGPGLAEKGFDGIQRPIQNIANTHGVFLPSGGMGGLDKTRQWFFRPLLKLGDLLQEGDIFGVVEENTMFNSHKIMFPPLSAGGRVTYIAPPELYTLKDPVLEVESSVDGKKSTYTMLQTWPVHQPRPVTERLPVDSPILTGFRVIDTLFPCNQGGTASVSAFVGHGEMILFEGLIKHSNSDYITFVTPGVRSFDTKEVIDSLAWIRAPGDANERVMKKMTLLADTTNTPVAVREVSIYTGIAIAEYVRDMGYNASLFVDSTSRWGEALREISSRLSEIPDEFGDPVTLNSRLSALYGRAGNVTCLGKPSRKGSLTIIGGLGHDWERSTFTDTTLGTTQTFWCLDRRLIAKKHFPAINWLRSYSRDLKALDEFYSTHSDLTLSSSEYVDFVGLRTKCQEILRKESEVMERSGKDKQNEIDGLTLHVAQLIRESFLQQNFFSSYENYCPLYKTALMLKNIVDYYDFGFKAIEKTSLSYPQLKEKLNQESGADLWYALFSQQYQNPSDGRETLLKFYKDLNRRITSTYDIILTHK